MVDDEVRHPVIVDTDALIDVANTSLWTRITENLQVTTTNVCYHELKGHVREALSTRLRERENGGFMTEAR